MTTKRNTAERHTVGNDAFASFVRRIVRAYVRRIADGDIEALGGLAALNDEVAAALGTAARDLNDAGYSWADIGRVTGRDRSNAFRSWGRQAAATGSAYRASLSSKTTAAADAYRASMSGK